MGVFTSSGQALLKAGAGVSADLRTSGAVCIAWDRDWIPQAESFIINQTKFDWSGAYATLSPLYKFTLGEVASAIAATYAVNYDMLGYGRAQAETTLDILRDRITAGLKILEDKNMQTFAGVI